MSDTFYWPLAMPQRRPAAEGNPGELVPESAARRDTGTVIAAAVLAVAGVALAALLASGPPPAEPVPVGVARAVAERCAAAPALCAPRAG